MLSLARTSVMSRRRRTREGQPAAAGDGDKMTEDRMDVFLALLKTPQFRLGVLGGVALLFGWTWRRKNGRRRKEEEGGEGKGKDKDKAEQSASSSEGKSADHGQGGVAGADGGLVAADPTTAIAKHPTASVRSEQVQPRGILFSRVDLVTSLQLATVFDPSVPAPDSGEDRVGDGAVVETGACFALPPYSPQKEVVKEVTEAGRLSPGENDGLDGSLPYGEDDAEGAQDGDRIRSIFTDSLAVRQSEDRGDGSEGVGDGGSSEERDIFAVSTQGQGLENGESGAPGDSAFSENLGDAVLKGDAVGFADGKPRDVEAVDFVPLIEAGAVDYVGDVASEKESLDVEHPDARSGRAGKSDLIVKDAVTRDSSIKGPESDAAAAAVHEVKHEIEYDGEGFGDGREDDVDGGEVEEEAGYDGKDKSDIEEHAGDAREGRGDIGNGGADLNGHRNEDDEIRRERNEGRGELEEDVSSRQPAGKDIIAKEPEWQQTQETSPVNGLTDVDTGAQGDDATSGTVVDLEFIPDDGDPLVDDITSIQSLEEVDDKATALDSIGSSDEGESDTRDKFVSSECADGVDDCPATSLSTPIAVKAGGVQGSLDRPADNMVDGLTSEKSLDRYDEYLADPKLPPSLRSQVMRAKAAVQKFYDLKGSTVSGSSTTF